MAKEEENDNGNQEESVHEETGRERILRDSTFINMTKPGRGIAFIGGVRNPVNKDPEDKKTDGGADDPHG